MSLLRFPVLVLLTVCSTDHTIPCKWDVSDERFFVLCELSNIISKIFDSFVKSKHRILFYSCQA